MSKIKLSEKQVKAMEIASDGDWHRSYELTPLVARNQVVTMIVNSLIKREWLEETVDAVSYRSWTMVYRITPLGIKQFGEFLKQNKESGKNQ